MAKGKLLFLTVMLMIVIMSPSTAVGATGVRFSGYREQQQLPLSDIMVGDAIAMVDILTCKANQQPCTSHAECCSKFCSYFIRHSFAKQCKWCPGIGASCGFGNSCCPGLTCSSSISGTCSWSLVWQLHTFVYIYVKTKLHGSCLNNITPIFELSNVASRDGMSHVVLYCSALYFVHVYLIYYSYFVSFLMYYYTLFTLCVSTV